MKRISLFVFIFLCSTIAWGQQGQGLVASLRVPQWPVCRDDFIVDFVLTNTGDKDIKIFERWNSWGAYNWIFEIKDAQGNIITFNNPQQKWTRNGPSTYEIKSGENFNLKSHLWLANSNLNRIWQHDRKSALETFVPLLKLNVGYLKGKLSIRGIYSNFYETTVTPDPFEEEAWRGVWQGTVETGWQEIEVISCKGPSYFKSDIKNYQLFSPNGEISEQEARALAQEGSAYYSVFFNDNDQPVVIKKHYQGEVERTSRLTYENGQPAQAITIDVDGNQKCFINSSSQWKECSVQKENY